MLMHTDLYKEKELSKLIILTKYFLFNIFCNIYSKLLFNINNFKIYDLILIINLVSILYNMVITIPIDTAINILINAIKLNLMYPFSIFTNGKIKNNKVFYLVHSTN